MSVHIQNILGDLRRQITSFFNREEVKNLCQDLSIPYENLGGEGHEAIIRELIAYCQRYGRISDLLNYCQRERPNAPWPTAEAINQALPGAIDDIAQTTRRYLRHLIERYQYLDYRGMGMVDGTPIRIPLLEMYIPLKARVEMLDDNKVSAPGQTTQATNYSLSEPLSLLELLQQYNGLVILGDPGAGKTTFLKYLALQLASEPEQTLGLNNRLPLVLSFSAYANALAEKDIPLPDFLAQFYRSTGLDLNLEAMIEDALAQGKALLLLDGLDEVNDDTLRHLLAGRILSFFAFQQQNGNKFVFTSRAAGYRDVRLVVDGLVECTLVDFDQSEIDQFVTKWTQLIEQTAQGETALALTQAEREKAELLATIQENPGLRRLATNPLLLTILVLMKRQGITLPERRVELYEQYIQILLRQWNLARSLDRPLSSKIDTIELFRVLAPVALWMHQTVSGIGLVERREIQRKLTEIYRQRGLPEPEQAASQFLQDVQVQVGLLAERGPGLYGFLHLTFQEYLAAVAVAQLGQSDIQPIITKLLKHITQENWREVILLTVAYIGLIQHRDEAASAILLGLVEQSGEQMEQATLLAADALHNAWPGGVTASCRAAVISALQSMMTNTTQTAAIRRARAGQLLAQVGDPREFVISVDEMHFCYIPSGPFWMGSGTDEHLNDSLSYSYWMSQFPITNAQFTHFVAAGGYDIAAFWTEAQAVDRWQDGTAQDWHSRGWRNQPHDYGSPYNLPNHPVVGITWYESLAFTRWLGQHWQEKGVLPGNWAVYLASEAEWEKAAKGGLEIPDEPLIEPVSRIQHAEIGRHSRQTNPFPNRVTPWAGDAEPNRANYQATGIEATNAAGCFANGATVYGCEEMCGNVWEWTRSQYRDYPYQAHDGRETERIKLYHQMVVRGGAYWVDALAISCNVRARRSPNDRNSNYGFRVVVIPQA